MKSLDLVAIGRSSVDLYGEQVGGRLEDMASFAKYIGGSPTNTAVGLARLGLDAALVTRVGADHMGRFIREQLVREGVDVRSVRTDPERLTALVMLGIRDSETFPLLFYRENCADMALGPGDLDEDQLGSAAALLINGTHLSAPGVLDASLKAVEIVRKSGGRVVLDIDYRPVLWGLAERDMGENRFVASAAVTEQLQQVLPLCDLVVGTEEEMHILGGSLDTVRALEAIRARTLALLVCKLGAAGCAAFPDVIPIDLSDGLVVAGFPVEVFNVLGAGDAFMAGFLSGWLRDEPVERCCMLGNACGAIVVSRHGCAPAMPTKVELEAFLATGEHPYRLREDASLEHVHWATTRRGDYPELTVFAFDHRTQFDELIEELDCPEDRVRAFKRLAYEAMGRIAQGDAGFGIIVDERFGSEVLAAAADHAYWVARPIETPRSRPLEFAGSADVGIELGTWPANQVVKCLVSYDADDLPELRERQERQLLRLFESCRRTGHELLVEIIAPAGREAGDASTARALDRLYEVGIKPDWWKLEPTSSAEAWRNIITVIEQRDPWCRGVVLLGLSSPIPELIESFEAAAGFPLIKGFAVGRTIFHDVAPGWLSGEIGDADAIDLMATRLSTLVDAWRSAKGRVKQAV